VIHPNGFTGGERFAALFFRRHRQPARTTRVALPVFDGVLKAIRTRRSSGHGGGYLGGYSGRIDHAWGAHGRRQQFAEAPTEYLRKI
jgi:aminocarboxymuconate-semialdehyde decarboxylase